MPGEHVAVEHHHRAVRVPGQGPGHVAQRPDRCRAARPRSRSPAARPSDVRRPARARRARPGRRWPARRARTPAAANRLTWCSRKGTPPTSSRCFGRCVVSGRRRLPKPPATMTASGAAADGTGVLGGTATSFHSVGSGHDRPFARARLHRPGRAGARCCGTTRRRPLVTFYDDATGERVELSVTTYANWVAKTAALVQDELDLERGAEVLLDLPTHWLGAVWLGAAWSLGLVVTDDPARADEVDLVVCGPGRPGRPRTPGRALGGRRALPATARGEVRRGRCPRGSWTTARWCWASPTCSWPRPAARRGPGLAGRATAR